MQLQYAPKFLKQLNKLEPALQKETLAKIELFKDRKNHKTLEVHKLKGRLTGSFSFSVNYKYRIVLDYISKNKAVLLTIGDHDVYKK